MDFESTSTALNSGSLNPNFWAGFEQAVNYNQPSLALTYLLGIIETLVHKVDALEAAKPAEGSEIVPDVEAAKKPTTRRAHKTATVPVEDAEPATPATDDGDA